MDRIGPRGVRGRDDGVGPKVRLGRCDAGKSDRGIGIGDVRTVGIGVGEYRDGAQSRATARGEHPAGDLSPVGDEHGLDGRVVHCLPHIRKTPKLSAPSIGAVAMADRHMPTTVRVSRGSMIPSS